MAENKKKRKRLQDGAGDVLQGGSGLFEVWEKLNTTENDLYAEIAKNPDVIPIPGADGEPVEGITYNSSSMDIAKAFDGSLSDVLENMANAYSEFTENMGADEARASIMALAKTLQPLFDFMKSEDFAKLKAQFSDFSDWMQSTRTQSFVADLLFWASLSDDMKSLLPFLLEEIKDLQQNPNIEDLTLKEFLRNVDANGNPTESLFIQAIDNARKKKADIEGEPAEIPNVTTKPIDRSLYPVDKINNFIWGLFAQAETNGQLAFATEKRGSKKESTIFYSINFEELENHVSISKKLTVFDKRVYVAISTLFNQGENIVSISQIYRAMGYKNRPDAETTKKITASLTKMNGARITVDNTNEHETYKNYPVFKYSGSLLPIETVSAYINGQLTEAAIHLFRQPPMITFAQQRNQITTIPIKLLESPVNKSPGNLSIDDYLIERIATMKRNKQFSRRILYKTVYENCGINSRMQKSRAKQTIARYLAWYAQTPDFNADKMWITGYTEQADGVTIVI